MTIDPAMSPELPASPFFLTALALATLGAILILAGIAALLRARPLRFAVRTLAGLLLLSLGGLAGTIAIGTQGYRALTREDVAARLLMRPVGLQRFIATVRFPDGSEKAFDIAGHVVKGLRQFADFRGSPHWGPLVELSTADGPRGSR